jgi:hypothetical protein
MDLRRLGPNRMNALRVAIWKRIGTCAALPISALAIVAIQLVIITGKIPSIEFVIRAGWKQSFFVLVVAVALGAHATWRDYRNHLSSGTGL